MSSSSSEVPLEEIKNLSDGPFHFFLVKAASAILERVADESIRPKALATGSQPSRRAVFLVLVLATGSQPSRRAVFLVLVLATGSQPSRRAVFLVLAGGNEMGRVLML